MEDTYGEKPIIYTYYHYYKDYLKGEFDDYPLWLANYNDVPTPSPDDEWQFWQFSENGIVLASIQKSIWIFIMEIFGV
jgi:lysozyme